MLSLIEFHMIAHSWINVKVYKNTTECEGIEEWTKQNLFSILDLQAFELQLS